MRNIWIIARREYKHYFSNPIAYVLFFVILITLGGFLYLDIFFAVQTQQFVPSLDRTFQLLIFPLLFLTVPAITMRSISEESRSGTLEILLTAPITDLQLIMGKWLGAFLFILSIIAVTLVYPLILNQLISPGIALGQVAAGYLGVILTSAAMCAIGVCISSFFSNQIAAFLGTLGVLLILWIIGAPAQISQTVSAEIMAYLSMPGHFSTTFLVGLIQLDSILYFLSVTALAIYLGSTAIEMRRWR
jgi:ABC-2 type transport system permease protein